MTLFGWNLYGWQLYPTLSCGGDCKGVENILATVERNQMAFKWDSSQDRAKRQAAINAAADLP